MKLVNPPVALMFHEGAPRLAAADICLPGLRPNASSRIALEAYPGLLARKQLGIRASYKSDTRSEHTAARRRTRAQIVRALKAGRPLGIVLELARRLEMRVIGGWRRRFARRRDLRGAGRLRVAQAPRELRIAGQCAGRRGLDSYCLGAGTSR
jgi:hypothetical protein